MKNQWEVVADYMNSNPHLGFTNAEAHLSSGLLFKAFNTLDDEVNLDLGLYCFPNALVYINEEYVGRLDEKGNAKVRGLKPGENLVTILGAPNNG